MRKWCETTTECRFENAGITSLPALPRVERLYVANNALTSLDGTNEAVRHVDISHNRFAELPLFLITSKTLCYLRFEDNPCCAHFKQHLTTFLLPTRQHVETWQRQLGLIEGSENWTTSVVLTGLLAPPAAFPLTLQHISLTNCRIDQLPAMPPGLAELVLAGCRFKRVPPNLPDLDLLDLSRNPLTSLHHLPRVRRTLLLANTLIKTIPDGVDVEALDISHCLFLRYVPVMPSLVNLLVKQTVYSYVLAQLPPDQRAEVMNARAPRDMDCSICLTVLNELGFIMPLPCRHVVCVGCFNGLVKANLHVRCGSCKMKTQFVPK